MRLISGIDTAMPDVRSKWNYHARWNQNERFWQEDFRQLADCGFDLLRWQVPWSLVEPRRGEMKWELIDPKVELATRLGLEILYPIVHFNMPSWTAGRGVRHPVYSPALPDHVAEYTDRILSRYHFRLVIPIVEVQMEAFQRGWLGNWQPHQKSRTSYRLILKNVIKAFKSSASVAHAHGATVFCSEPASELETVAQLSDSIDIAGIDLYPHMHRQWTVLGYLQRWSRAAGKPLCISEFGIPETYDPTTGVDDCKRFIQAGIDRHRVVQARQLRQTLQRATAEGIQIPYGGWYPGTGNIGWGSSLTRERRAHDCDRAGLVDLARQPDGVLQRVLCEGLLEEVLMLRDVGPCPQRSVRLVDTIPAPPVHLRAELPQMPNAPALEAAKHAAGD
ncbi:MAG TPA: beta-galactosidase [Bryobacteraceae bacterium]|nr:beta-galactosidase [Bryobacteraceae bacterium]